MQLGRFDVHDPAKTVGGLAAGLLHQKRHGVALIEQAQLAVRGVGAGRIDVDAALEQVAMKIGNQGTDIAGGVGSVGRFVPLLAIFQVLLHPVRELDVVALVDGVDLAFLRNANVLVGEAEATDGGIIGKAVDAKAGGVDQHGGRAIDHVTGGDLTVARLQEIFQGHRAALRADTTVDGEDGPDRDVDIDVGRAVERVNQHHIFGVLGERRIEGDEVLFFFRRHAAHLATGFEGSLEALVGIHVQLLLHLALHVLGTHGADDIRQPRLVDLPVHHLGRQADGAEQWRQLAGCGWVIRLLFDDELAHGDHVSHCWSFKVVPVGRWKRLQRSKKKEPILGRVVL